MATKAIKPGATNPVSGFAMVRAQKIEKLGIPDIARLPINLTAYKSAAVQADPTINSHSPPGSKVSAPVTSVLKTEVSIPQMRLGKAATIA
jgi:hypothetical protein